MASLKEILEPLYYRGNGNSVRIDNTVDRLLDPYMVESIKQKFAKTFLETQGRQITVTEVIDEGIKVEFDPDPAIIKDLFSLYRTLINDFFKFIGFGKSMVAMRVPYSKNTIEGEIIGMQNVPVLNYVARYGDYFSIRFGLDSDTDDSTAKVSQPRAGGLDYAPLDVNEDGLLRFNPDRAKQPIFIARDQPPEVLMETAPIEAAHYYTGISTTKHLLNDLKKNITYLDEKSKMEAANNIVMEWGRREEGMVHALAYLWWDNIQQRDGNRTLEQELGYSSGFSRKEFDERKEAHRNKMNTPYFDHFRDIIRLVGDHKQVLRDYLKGNKHLFEECVARI
jgi:hypothetical protein